MYTLKSQTLLGIERQQNAAAKAVRAANRSRRRRQELWEQEVYGGGSFAGSNSGLRAMSRSQKDSVHDQHSSSTVTHPIDGPNHPRRDVAPSFETPTRPTPRRTSRPIPAAEIVSASLDRVTPPPVFAPLEAIDDNTDIEMSRLGSPTSAPISQNGFDDELGEEFVSIGAYTGRGAKFRDGSLDEDATRISSWGRNGPENTGAAMSWVAGEEDGGGRITPKTALRFKTSALSRAMHR